MFTQFVTPFAPLLGGMPSVTLSDVAVPRLEVISFFLMGLVISAGVVMLVWNVLAKDFAWLPRLSFGKACGVVVLWGLLFVIVLTMISGARELMTPGAWEKEGLTYRLRDQDRRPEKAESPVADDREARRTRIIELMFALVEHAHEHGGHYPDGHADLKCPRQVLELPDLSGTRYILVPGRTKTGPPLVLAYEPEVYEGKHFVAFTSGPPRELAHAEIRRLLAEETTSMEPTSTEPASLEPSP